MNKGQRMRGGAGLGVLLLLGLPMAPAQSARSHAPVGATMPMLLASNADMPKLQAEDQVIREIDDPCTGMLWLVVRDAAHPGGPGKLVMAQGAVLRQRLEQSGRSQGVTLPADAKEKMLPLSSSPPMIRSGERILVEEHTSVVDAQLEAIALRSAKRGEVLQVRLVLGGSILKARVSGPGSAELVTEARP